MNPAAPVTRNLIYPEIISRDNKSLLNRFSFGGGNKWSKNSAKRVSSSSTELGILSPLEDVVG